LSTPKEPILRVQNLKKYFPVKAGVFSRVVGQIKAVDGVSFSINEGETFGLVGESGCGKSTLGRTILKLLEPNEGEVFYKGEEIYKMQHDKLRSLRREIQIIFQDPYGSLNPRMTVGEAIGESLEAHGIAKGAKRRERVEYLLDVCGLAPYHFRRYPHEFSGGQRQRIGIARALALNPNFVVADEPISALDVSIQAQIINLLEDLQQEFGLTYMFISHDLSMVKHISDRVAVMYLGVIAEMAPKKDLYQNPLHPYSQALLSAVPVMDPTMKKERIILRGDVPSPANPPEGCRFNTRCHYAVDRCRVEIPELREVVPDHFVSCHLVEEL
jgi:oligopeptide/dipeptide ABC transporter ATP-binding protein